MFDSSANLKMPAPARLGDVELTVRYPADQEWYARARARKYITHNMGRGRKETIMPEPGEPEARLFAAISLNGTPPISAAEAAMILEALGQAMVTDVRTEAGTGIVEMITVTGKTIHKMEIPTADQIFRWRRGAVRVFDLLHGQQELRLNPEAGAELYDACKGRSEDYSSAIPGPHKDSAIKALVEYIDQNVGPRTDDANF
jgi:hypothetical protein